MKGNYIHMNPSQNPSALRSKSEITRALLRLLKDYDFSEITVKHILIEAQIARKTFYRNFTSKEDVLQSYIKSLILEYVNRLVKLAQSTTDLSPDNILRIIFSICLENKDFLICLHKNCLMYVLLQQMDTVISQIHTNVVPSDHYLFSDITPEFNDYIVSFNVGAIWTTINKWIERGMNDTPEIIINQLEKFLSKLTNCSD